MKERKGLSLKYVEILKKVNKPSRYAGGEYNSCDYKKKHKMHMVICFPEPYEIAMSNLGIKILYHMQNQNPDIVCERCFMPYADFSDELLKNNIPLFTIESKKSLNNSDILGFSIHHELCYTNILHMLKLAGIPFYAKDRGEAYPLIMAGGPAAANPEPLAAFFDLFIIGEGETPLKKFSEHYIKNRRKPKAEILKSAQHIEGIYIPSLYEVKYKENGRIKQRVALSDVLPVKKAYERDLDKTFYPVEMIVPVLEAAQDRAVAELYRGCSNGCRFCQAGFYTRPVRERSAENVTDICKGMLHSTGYEELSLSSLSTGDYSGLAGIYPFVKELEKKNVSVSLPSLRLSGSLKEYQYNVNQLTFAPEAGSERLRRVINKNVTQNDIDETLNTAFSEGCKNIKLYFMCGLPTETEEDIKAIEQLALFAKRTHSAAGRCRMNLSVSLAVFIPKPFTPFEYEDMDGKESVVNKINLIKSNLIKSGIRLSYHDYDSSFLEAVFARGDRRLSDVLIKAYESGCIFDGWSEFFKFEKWVDAFAASGIVPDFYVRGYSLNDVLPWHFIDSGIRKEYFAEERQKAYREETTDDCRKGCKGCGFKGCF